MKSRRISRLQVYALTVLILSLALAQVPSLTQAQRAQNNQWSLSFYSTNAQNVARKTFLPFDQIQLVASVAYGNASQPGILVAFKVRGPTDAVDQTNITRIIPTDNEGQAEFEFRLPIENQNNDTVVGTWQATATIQTTNGTLERTLSFTTQWSMEIASITIQNAKGQNQTSFPAGSTVTVKLAINNNGQAQATNVSMNMQGSSGNINQTQIQNVQIGTSNPTKVQANIEIPSDATAGQAFITAALFSGSFEGTNIPEAQNKTASFTITSATKPTSTPTPTPKQTPFQNSISLFSWLLVATALFTFTSLTLFLRRKPYPPSGQTSKFPTVPVTSTPTLSEATQLAIPGSSAIEILAQQSGLQPLATQLSTISSAAQRIEALQTALRMEKQQLAKDIADFTKTVDEQEKAITIYFETIRQEMKRLGTYIGDKNIAQTEAKVERNAPPSEEENKHKQTISPSEVNDKQTDLPEQSRPARNTKLSPRDYDALRQERTEEEDIRTEEHTRED